MTKQTIFKAATEARAFLDRVKALTEDDYRFIGIAGSGRTGALRRQSMELTRALSAMRRPGGS